MRANRDLWVTLAVAMAVAATGCGGPLPMDETSSPVLREKDVAAPPGSLVGARPEGVTRTRELSFFGSAAGRRVQPSVRYLHQLVSTPEQCAQLMALGANCEQVVEFCADGTMWMIATDIVNKGTFGFDGELVWTSFGAGREPELPESVIFIPNADESRLEDAWLKVAWEKDTKGQWTLCH